jgi:5'-methylthioadenosine phosphorylase
MPSAEIGVFGGSGFYSLLEGAQELQIETRWGAPSDAVTIGEIAGRRVAFLPRHGKRHQFPPQSINYRANVDAMKQLGVTRILAPTAAGSLQPHVKPGDFVVCDQLVDRTSGRAATFFDGPRTVHVSFADPYCPELRAAAWQSVQRLSLPAHEHGTVVVIEGPRFSTRAESRWFRAAGWEVINMTQYPEAVLAREAEICYVNIALITDYDAGVEGDPSVKPVSHHEVLKAFEANLGRLRTLIGAVIDATPRQRACPCGTALQGAL